MYGLTSTELQFIKNHRLEFVDNLTVKLTYPGAAAPNITVTDPETNNTINLNFTGNTILRTSPIMYMDGLFSAGYEGVKSFAIATSKVNDDILAYWLNKNSTYPVGAMKAAYGTFLTALITEYVHDQVADQAASEYNVTWTRTHPIAVSVGDDAYQTYLTLECDHSMGMTVAGSLKNILLFNYICSSSISPIEYAVMDNLGYGQINTFDMSVNSVTLDLIDELIIYNASLEYFIQGGYIIYKAVDRDDNFLVLDLETCIMRDINTINNYYGAYCFHDTLTGYSYGLGKDLNQEKKQFNWRKLMYRLGVYGGYIAGGLCIGAGVLLAETGVGAIMGIGSGIGIISATLIADSVDPYTNEDWWV
ncbi:MAG: hypothetical protein HVN34_06220 [Methanobacteriaceae archaeon]|jgi:hypothetical protein|nr:hypothetical protein [Methanobacteriaceae archaeon]